MSGQGAVAARMYYSTTMLSREYIAAAAAAALELPQAVVVVHRALLYPTMDLYACNDLQHHLSSSFRTYYDCIHHCVRPRSPCRRPILLDVASIFPFFD
jgi:hypothetical protein